MEHPSIKLGKLYLIPTGLGNSDLSQVLPVTASNTVENLQLYIAENEKTARRFIKSLLPDKKQSELKFEVLNKRTEAAEFRSFLKPCEEGKDMGLLSEVGCPGVADPGAHIVRLAHQKGIQVVPLVGPSSIILAMMASGLNGQNFAFHGYLPIDKKDKKNALKHFEQLSETHNQAQIFIETPYRNEKLFTELTKQLHPHTWLCIARDITLPTEFISTRKIKDWKKQKPDLHKKPAIFIFQKESF